eukprot:Lankesteria_metandrocarpae@DN1395_c0_g1_i1.p1
MDKYSARILNLNNFSVQPNSDLSQQQDFRHDNLEKGVHQDFGFNSSTTAGGSSTDRAAGAGLGLPESVSNAFQNVSERLTFGANSMSNQLQSTVTGNDASESCCPSLTWTERILGFSVCFAAGVIVSLASLTSLTEAFLGMPTKFAIGYTLGNLLSLCSTVFLVGPVKQFQNMTDHNRRVASGIYFVCLLLTLSYVSG